MSIKKSKKAIIFGTGSFAEIVEFYLTNDSPYEVVGFTVTGDHKKEDRMMGRPIVPFEVIEKTFSPEEHELFIAIGYRKLNRIRRTFYEQAKQKNYHMLSYISSKATIWTKKIGEHCFIFEDNTIQPYVEIGNNVILWSGNHIGHHSVIEDHCFISSHVVISGHSRIKEGTFIGVNATLRDAVTVGKENIIGAGAIIMKNTQDEELYVGSKTAASSQKSTELKSF